MTDKNYRTYKGTWDAYQRKVVPRKATISKNYEHLKEIPDGEKMIFMTQSDLEKMLERRE